MKQIHQWHDPASHCDDGGTSTGSTASATCLFVNSIPPVRTHLANAGGFHSRLSLP